MDWTATLGDAHLHVSARLFSFPGWMDQVLLAAVATLIISLHQLCFSEAYASAEIVCLKIGCFSSLISVIFDVERRPSIKKRQSLLGGVGTD